MISFDNLLNMIEQCKTPYIRIFDTYGNPLFAFDDDTNVETTKVKLRNVAPMLENYGKVVVHGATKNMKAASWRGAYKWTVNVSSGAGMGQQKQDQGFQSNWNWGMVPKGYVPESTLLMQMQHFKETQELKLQMMKLEMEANNKKYPIPPEYLPYMGKLLGWSPTEIKEMAGITVASKINGLPDVHTTLRFKDVQKMSVEEKAAKVNELLQKLETKVSAEHMILLLEALNERPELADKAVKAFQAGLI